jgi:hypothetical protein
MIEKRKHEDEEELSKLNSVFSVFILKSLVINLKDLKAFF